jgi:hypothetical protein
LTVAILPASEQVGDGPPPVEVNDVALEFVRFCYRRRHVAWPQLYDEMSAVASRGLFRGMGYSELGEHGVSFCLADLHRLVALAAQVIAEETPTTEPLPGMATLSLAPATH